VKEERSDLFQGSVDRDQDWRFRGERLRNCGLGFRELGVGFSWSTPLGMIEGAGCQHSEGETHLLRLPWCVVSVHIKDLANANRPRTEGWWGLQGPLAMASRIESDQISNT
jgi:hypothetical protein